MTKRFHTLVFRLALLLMAGCAQNRIANPSSESASAGPVTDRPAAPVAAVSASTPAPAPDLTNNLASPAQTINPKLPSIFVAGDSTAARGASETQRGWAAPFAGYFDPSKINVVNRARGGRSSRTFITEGLWDQLLADVKAGDIVLIQFGHNDAGAINDASRARGSIRGLGEESEEIDNLLTKKHEVVHTYGWYMRKMIADTRAKGATPIVLSLTVRNVWKDGKIERGSGRYSRWSAEIARAARVQFINVTDLVADKFEPMGEDQVKLLYPRDHTHFNAVGADLHAAMVVSGLKGLRPDPIGKFLSAKGEAVEPDRWAWLNLPRPANPALPTLFLIGDSTVRNGRGDGAGGQWGWGDSVGSHFDSEKLNVVNRAVGGLSSRTFLTQGHWENVLALMKKGDFVMMQFGHNDRAPLNDGSRARGTIQGVGEEFEEVDNQLTKQHEVVHSYGWYLRKYIGDTRAKGATPIVCSLVPRKTWKDGKIARNKESFAGWAEQVAKAEGVAFIDLNERIAQRYDELGQEKVEPLFADEHTHTSAAGAELNAQCVVAGLKALAEDPLANYLSAGKPDQPVAAPVQNQSPTSFKFDFGLGKVASGYRQVTPEMFYSAERGFGFEPGANLKTVECAGVDALRDGMVSSDKPFFFSVAVPEGNYKVTVTLGGVEDRAEVTVKAELRRLMLERVRIDAGKFETRSFIVNVRRPTIAGDGEVRLTQREKTSETWAWDDRLSLEFNGSHVSIAALEIEKVELPTVFLIGDSTVCDQPGEPFNSWGQMITRFFEPSVAVANHAESGESIAGALAKGRFEKIWSEMKKGDYLIVQFGHNDMKSPATNALETYTENLRKIVDQARKLGGTPVLCTSVSRRTFDQNGKITNSFRGYTDAVRSVAQEKGVPLIDLQNMGVAFYESMGPEVSHQAFANDRENTHHGNYGSYEIAKCVLQGIRENKLGLADVIVKEFVGFDPAHPDPISAFNVPPSPSASSQTPAGN